MNRKEFLSLAETTICQSRRDLYGNAENCFQTIADYWSIFLSRTANVKVELEPHDVAMMMSLFKIARWHSNPAYQDNIVDGIGYMALAGEMEQNDEWLPVGDFSAP